MRSDFEMRRATRADWDDIAALHARSRVAELHACGRLDAIGALPRIERHLPDFPGELRVARVAGALAGFCGFVPDEVVWLYVDPARFRQGIGSRLLRDAIAACGRVCEASVLEHNSPALALYVAEGFGVIGTAVLDPDISGLVGRAHRMRRTHVAPSARIICQQA